MYHIYKGDFERTNLALQKCFGPIVSLAPGEYSTDDPEAAKLIYGSSGSSSVKAPWHWVFGPPDQAKASLFSDSDGKHHAVQKRKFAKSNSMSLLVKLEGFVDHCSEMLVERLSSFARPLSQTVRLQSWLQFFAFDVIGEIAFGRLFGLLESGRDNGVIKVMGKRLLYSSLVGLYLRLHAWLYPCIPKVGGHGFVMDFTIESIVRRKKELELTGAGVGRRRDRKSVV